ncbi:MAG TPA: hypothetical protein VGB55_12520 [Tepidisphaeraceae bacterium]
MGLHEGRGNLNKGLKDLLMHWQNTRESWDDTVSEQFEKNYLEPLEQAIRSATTAMDQMAQVLGKIDRDCK